MQIYKTLVYARKAQELATRARKDAAREANNGPESQRGCMGCFQSFMSQRRQVHKIASLLCLDCLFPCRFHRGILSASDDPQWMGNVRLYTVGTFTT